MKKWLSTTLACCLLASGIWAGSAGAVYGAESTVSLSVNHEDLQLPAGAASYVSGTTVMVPVRPVAEALELEVSYVKETKGVDLKAGELELSLKAGESQVAINGQDIIAFEGTVVFQGGRIYVPLNFFYSIGLVTAYDSVSGQAEVSTPKGAAEDITGLLASGKYEELSQTYFNEGMKAALPVSVLQQSWESLSAPNGGFVQLKSVQNSKEDQGIALMGVVSFAKGEASLWILIDSSGKIISLTMSPLPAEATVPATITEEEIVVGAETSHPLKGTLTLPRNAQGPIAAVVLVHGSGASDRDETALGYKPFRDIAWGLAQQGIAVLRYDKRTYTYGQEYAGDASAEITVKEETMDDAIAAGKLLKSDKRINPARVYIAGHSLGGMLAPRIEAEGGDFAGLILLAGSPRKLWEIMGDQYSAAFHALDDQNPVKAQSLEMLAAELARAKQLDSWSDAEAKAASLFGAPAYYFKEMDQHSTAELARKLTKPVLVMQGKDDFQVYADKDYPLWQEVLKGNAQTSYKLYPGLNHFFVNYDGVGAGTAAEYNVPGFVDHAVIKDMAEWIKAR